MDSPQSVNAAPLESQLLSSDTQLRDVVEDFVAHLDERLAELRRAHDRLDWNLLASLTHGLKGAAGSYGYPSISQVCATMEQVFQMHLAGEFATWTTELECLAAAARAGLRDCP